MKINDALPYTILASIALMNIFIVEGLINIFLGWSPTIIAGVIAFVGAIIGGSLTLIGVKWTLTSQFEKENNKKFEANKTIFSASKMVLNFNEEDRLGRKESSRILLTDSLRNLSGLEKDVAYYSVIRYAGTDIITNCQFTITVGNDGNFEDFDVIEVWVDYFERDEELLIPICSSKLDSLNPWVKEIRATLYTLNNDKIEFVQSEIENTRNHIFYNGDVKQEHGFNTKYTAWAQKSR